MEIKVEKLPVATACFFGFDPSFTKEREYDQKYLPGSYNRERKKKVVCTTNLYQNYYMVMATADPLAILSHNRAYRSRAHEEGTPRRRRRSGNRQRLRRFVGQKPRHILEPLFQESMV